MDGTDRNLEIPTRGLVPQPIKNFTAAGAGTRKPLGLWGDSLAGAEKPLSLTGTPWLPTCTLTLVHLGSHPARMPSQGGLGSERAFTRALDSLGHKQETQTYHR